MLFRSYLRGGHRLWYAPEQFPLSSLPDNQPVTVEQIDHGFRLSQIPEKLTGIQKSIEILLDDNRPTIRVIHTLTNWGAAPQKIAPWGITLLPSGGVAILPQHTRTVDEDGLLPNRNLVLWPYTQITDPRLGLGEDYWTVQADSNPRPCKIGYLNLSGWVAYQFQGLIFCKWFSVDHTLPLADMGVNIEVYANQHALELETLGQLALLAPGESVVQTEHWGCFESIDDPFLDDYVRRVIKHHPG